MAAEKIGRTLNWYFNYILKFHPVKYFGIIIMISGPLYFLYRFIFIENVLYHLLFGSIGFFILGAVIWRFGWDYN